MWHEPVAAMNGRARRCGAMRSSMKQNFSEEAA
jgi:hypothetical protein